MNFHGRGRHGDLRFESVGGASDRPIGHIGRINVCGSVGFGSSMGQDTSGDETGRKLL